MTIFLHDFSQTWIDVVFVVSQYVEIDDACCIRDANIVTIDTIICIKRKLIHNVFIEYKNACFIYECKQLHKKHNWNELVYMTQNLFVWFFVTTKRRHQIFNNDIFYFQRRYNSNFTSLKCVYLILQYHQIIIISYVIKHWLQQLHDRITSKKSFWNFWKDESNV